MALQEVGETNDPGKHQLVEEIGGEDLGEGVEAEEGAVGWELMRVGSALAVGSEGDLVAVNHQENHADGAGLKERSVPIASMILESLTGALLTGAVGLALEQMSMKKRESRTRVRTGVVFICRTTIRGRWQVQRLRNDGAALVW
jgi:hypothetical protein